jgi:hypothetical protein
MDNFEAFQMYLLNGSDTDEGLTAQEEFDEIQRAMQIYMDKTTALSLYQRISFYNVSSFTDARSNQLSSGCGSTSLVQDITWGH